MGGLTDPVLGTWKGCRLTLGAGPARAEPATHGHALVSCAPHPGGGQLGVSWGWGLSGQMLWEGKRFQAGGVTQ